MHVCEMGQGEMAALEGAAREMDSHAAEAPAVPGTQ